MPNMSYCRMENTYRDLVDVQQHWNDTDSDTELKYREKILKICKEISDDFGEFDEEDE